MFRHYEISYSPLLNVFPASYIQAGETKGVFAPFGEDNLLPSYLMHLAREVPIHRAILNSKTNYVSGQGIQSSNAVLKDFIMNPNNSGEHLFALIRRVIFDYMTFGNAFIEVITDGAGSFVSVFHHDASKVRIDLANRNALLHPDWSAYKSKDDKDMIKISLFPEYQPIGGVEKKVRYGRQTERLYHCMYHFKDYEPEFYYYGLPSYYAGLRNVLISLLTSIWNQKRLQNAFAADGLLVIPGVNNEEDAKTLDAEFSKLKGSLGEKSGNIVIQYLEDAQPGTPLQEAKFIKFPIENEGNWLELIKAIDMALITIHGWFKSLTPYSDEKAGFDTKRIVNEWEIAQNTVIAPLQEFFISGFRKIFAGTKIQFNDFEFVNQPPVERINPFKFVWEVRRDSGLDYDRKDPNQAILVQQVKNIYPTEYELKV